MLACSRIRTNTISAWDIVILISLLTNWLGPRPTPQQRRARNSGTSLMPAADNKRQGRNGIIDCSHLFSATILITRTRPLPYQPWFINVEGQEKKPCFVRNKGIDGLAVNPSSSIPRAELRVNKIDDIFYHLQRRLHDKCFTCSAAVLHFLGVGYRPFAFILCEVLIQARLRLYNQTSPWIASLTKWCSDNQLCSDLHRMRTLRVSTFDFHCTN